jgi:hypothetical protein
MVDLLAIGLAGRDADRVGLALGLHALELRGDGFDRRHKQGQRFVSRYSQKKDSLTTVPQLFNIAGSRHRRATKRSFSGIRGVNSIST